MRHGAAKALCLKRAAPAPLLEAVGWVPGVANSRNDDRNLHIL
jgi:hypothetical protein